MSSREEYEAHYRIGNYERCEHTIQLVLDTLARTEENASGARYELKLIPPGVDRMIWEWILENNIVVVRGLKIVSTHQNWNDWDKISQAMLEFHGKLKSYHRLGKSTLDLYLVSVYNNFCWEWLKPLPILNNHGSNVEHLLQIIIDCFSKVSEICKLSPLSQSSTEKVELCLHLMKRTSSYVLQLEIRHGLQLVETVMLALLVLLESKKIDSTLTDLCMLVMSNIHETWDIIEKKLKKYDWNETREENTNPQLFKFGFQQLNDFVQNSNPQLVYDNVCILGSLVFVHLGAMEKSLGFFHISTERHKDVQCQFLWHYMQAYASYSLKEWDMCMLHIKVLSSLPLTSESEAYYHLLSGQLQSSMKNYSRAHEEFGKAIESGHCLYSAVYHLLINMKNALLESTLGKIEGNSTTSLSYSKYRKALSSLYEFMELSKHNSSDYGEVSFGHKILTCLYQQEKVSPAQVFYMIAQEMFQMKTSSDEDDDDVAVCPSRVIAECLTSALELIKKSDGMDSFKPVRVLYHEAAVALLMDGQLAMAESACALPIEHPLSTDTPDTEEGILLSLHEDIVGLLLLAYIKRCTEQYDEEAELLNRCKKTVVNYFFNYSTKGAQLASTCKSHLMDALAARMYLMKGLMHLRNQNNVDAKENFERAFQHNPGDPLIQRHCTSACTANGKVSLATAPIAEQHSNIALQYLLSNDTSFK